MRLELTKKVQEYINAMYSGQIICREVITAHFVLTESVSRNVIKEILWALDRHNVVFVTDKVECPQCESLNDNVHRMIVKLNKEDGATRAKAMESIKKWKNNQMSQN